MSYQHAFDCISICMRMNFTQYLLTQKGIKVEIMIECDCCHLWILKLQMVFFFYDSPFLWYVNRCNILYYLFMYYSSFVHNHKLFYDFLFVLYKTSLSLYNFLFFYLYCIHLIIICITEHSCIKTQCHKVLVNALFIVCILLFEMIGNII